MAKRFTASDKWRNSWFRPLPLKAKLVWLYMCDECDLAGIWKPDFALASFQLDFTLTHEDIKSWFGSKVHFFDSKILIVPFFEFQYGDTKDSWSAKKKAVSVLNNNGFTIENNKILILDELEQPQPPHSGHTVLSTGIGISEGISKSRSTEVHGLRNKIDQAFDVWNDTLEYFKLPRGRINIKQTSILSTSIMSLGFEEVLLALEGARYETANKDFNPLNHLSLQRVLQTSNNGKSNWERFMNMAMVNKNKNKVHKLTEEELNDQATGRPRA